MEPFSVYIHIPFCLHHCGYCDFNTYSGKDNLIPAYVDALVCEIQSIRNTTGERLPVHTVYFGGGTPSLLPSPLIGSIVNSLETSFFLLPGIEISLEANPGTLSLTYLQDLRAIGINRISLGMQSANLHELVFLDRKHSYTDVVDAVEWIRQANINNLSLDLIFGLPEQSNENWHCSITKGINLDPEHFSLYALTIEPGTLMYRWTERGLISQPDTDIAAEMYESADRALTAAGYVQYEISNWSKMDHIGHSAKGSVNSGQIDRNVSPSLACRHNLQYWRNLPYLGFGAGAHGFAGGKRTNNVKLPLEYIQRLVKLDPDLEFPITPATANTQPIDRETEMGETLMMGLRLMLEGVSRNNFQTRFQEDVMEVYGHQIKKFLGLGLLSLVGQDDDILRLTKRGRLLGNQVFMGFV